MNAPLVGRKSHYFWWHFLWYSCEHPCIFFNSVYPYSLISLIYHTMIKLLYLIIFSVFWVVQGYTAESPTMCTTQYEPVCGWVQVQCITAPCDPVPTDFSNSCMAAAAGATDIMWGACNISQSTPPIVWGDRDSHGCIASAGYRWESRVGQCLRPWESRVRIMNIAPMMTPCVFGVLQTECLQARFAWWNQPWTFVYGEITWYNHISGSTDRLLVLETRIENPPADGSAISYSLIKMLSKQSLSSLPIENPLLGTWTLNQLNNMTISNPIFTIVFDTNRVSAKFCNSVSGSYSRSGSTIIAPIMMSTMMYCDGQPMTLENAFSLDGATYSLRALRLMAGSTGPTMQLIITTKKGDVFTYGMR